MIKCKVIQSGNQIDSQHKSATAIPIPLRQNPKDFQMPDDVFDYHSLFCQLLVELLLFFGQLTAFRLFYRCPRVLVPVEQALITGVRQAFNFFWQIRFAVFVERKVVSCALGSVSMICLVFLHARTWVFIVCRFFFPE